MTKRPILKRRRMQSSRRKIQGAELFVQIEQVLKDPSVIADPKLSRKSVADRLGSNESYVRAAIMECTGLTFSAYLTGTRLACARELLLSPEDMIPVAEIARRCGLGVSTFYRVFKKDCGMTPEEYWNEMGNDETNENNTENI